MARPLRLKQESANLRQPESAQELPIASVMVDSGVYHLDYLHDYKVPEELSRSITAGTRVQVSFNGIRREGIVYLRRSTPERAGRLLSIEKVLGPTIAHQQSIDLVSAVVKRWPCHPFDVWRTLLPPRVINVESKVVDLPVSTGSTAIKVGDELRSYHFLPPFSEETQEISGRVKTFLDCGNVLLILPDEKNVEDFILNSSIENVVNLSPSLPKGIRYLNYLSMEKAENVLFIGTRSAVFAPIKNLSAIMVHREISENFYEIRSPGWNVRDVALMRSELEKVKVLFTGYGPSSEMGRLISLGYVKFFDSKAKVSVVSANSDFGELLPSKILASMKRALSKGSILVLVPRKGYASGVVCSSCRNVAHHSCGGVITRASLRGDLLCTSCNSVIASMVCHWCKNPTFSIIGRGSARISEEIGRAFPGKIIVESSSERMVLRTEGAGKIVIATAGAQPTHVGSFAGTFIVEAERFLAGINLRSIERAEESFFSTIARGGQYSEVGIVINESHPVVASLMKWNPKLLLIRSLREREEAHLPPYLRCIEIDVPKKELPNFESGVRKAISDGRLPPTTHIRMSGDKFRIDIAHRDAVPATAFFHEYLRKRSATGKKIFSMRIDPYEFA